MLTILGSGNLAQSFREIATPKSGYKETSAFEHDRMILALDHLDYRQVEKVSASISPIGNSWIVVSLFSRYICFSPIFGHNEVVCPNCFLRRIAAAPPGTNCAETEFAVSTIYSRGAAPINPAFTMPMARFSFQYCLKLLGEPVNIRTARCELIDQIGLMHNSALISPVHGCGCRQDTIQGIDRFSHTIKQEIGDFLL